MQCDESLVFFTIREWWLMWISVSQFLFFLSMIFSAKFHRKNVLQLNYYLHRNYLKNNQIKLIEIRFGVPRAPKADKNPYSGIRFIIYDCDVRCVCVCVHFNCNFNSTVVFRVYIAHPAPKNVVQFLGFVQKIWIFTLKVFM